jgi:hypothetical protein
VLIATSRYYSIGKVMPLLMPLLLNLGLVVLGTWLVFHSIGRLHHYDRLIRELTRNIGRSRRLSINANERGSLQRGGNESCS